MIRLVNVWKSLLVIFLGSWVAMHAFHLLPSAGKPQEYLDVIIHRVIDEKQSEEEKILALHNEVARLLTYDDRCLKGRSDCVVRSFEAVQFKTGNCRAYTELMSLLLHRINIPNVYQYGHVYSTEYEKKIYHVWNKVFWDGHWRNVDVTFDDSGDQLRTTYFGINDAELSFTHEMNEIEKIANGPDRMQEVVLHQEVRYKVNAKRQLISRTPNGKSSVLLDHVVYISSNNEQIWVATESGMFLIDEKNKVKPKEAPLASSLKWIAGQWFAMNEGNIYEWPSMNFVHHGRIVWHDDQEMIIDANTHSLRMDASSRRTKPFLTESALIKTIGERLFVTKLRQRDQLLEWTDHGLELVSNQVDIHSVMIYRHMRFGKGFTGDYRMF